MEALKCSAMRNPERSEYTKKFYNCSCVITGNIYHTNVVSDKCVSAMEANYENNLQL
jgi:6,7-dimethyl-8-ribityllumazine synthase